MYALNYIGCLTPCAGDTFASSGYLSASATSFGSKKGVLSAVALWNLGNSLGLRVHGFGLRIQGLGFRVQGSGFRAKLALKNRCPQLSPKAKLIPKPYIPPRSVFAQYFRRCSVLACCRLACQYTKERHLQQVYWLFEVSG